MSANVLEISEGFAPDGATTRIFEPPQVNQDNQRPRYLAFLGSFVTPEVASQRPWTKGGGYELANPCLRYVKNFLRKGRITPLLKDTHDFLPYDYVKKTTEIDPLSAGYFAQQIPPGYVPPNLPPPNGQGMLGAGAMGGFSPYGMMVGRLALPGEQIGSILHGDDNVCRNFGRKGVVEFTSLLGHEYRPVQIQTEAGAINVDRTLWEIQRAIFPQFPLLPIKLNELEQLLDEAPTTLQAEVGVYRESLSQFRNYADVYIQNVHQQMRERGPSGYVRPYTAGDLVLLEQLGMERQDRAPRTPVVPVSNARTEELFQQIMELQVEEKRLNIERQRRLESIGQGDGETGETIVTNSTPAGQEVMSVAMADSVDSLRCECGRLFDSAGGLKVHKNQWCELNKAGEATEG